jgi:ABC-2 type transport system ATP-binding protein/lipopolysaccharide transport system ATP-binding protein
VKEVKELSGLGGYFELPVHTYSAGMKSRLVMSLMRLVRGDILVMDEWISAADASVNETANRLQAELITSTSILLIASHSRPILEEWTNRLVWLDRGEVRAVGGVAEVLKEYHAWAAKDRTAR